MQIANLITLNRSSSDLTAVYAQTITKTMGMGIPKWMDSPFQTATIAFNDTGGDQYEWVIEFTCGGLGLLFPGGFVGINLYSRVLADSHLQQMLETVRNLNLSWVLEKGFHNASHPTSCNYSTHLM